MSSVAVIGAGMNLDGGASQETRALVEAADVVVTILSEPHASRFLRGLRVAELRYALTSLRPDRVRIDNYREIAKAVVEAAVSGSKVCYLTYGNPAIFDRIAHLIIEACADRGVPCSSPPATSAIDAIFSYLREDVAPGLQVFDCTWMVRESIVPCTRATLLLMQPAVFGADGIVDVRERGSAMLRPLTDYLLRFYTEEHPATFVRAPLSQYERGYRRMTPIRGLHSGPADDLLSTSIVIRPRHS